MKENGLHIADNGTQFWYKDGKFHRDDGPAAIWSDGEQWWCKDGNLHRDDGPAIIYSDGSQEWFKKGNKYEPSAHELIAYKMNERERIAHCC